MRQSNPVADERARKFHRHTHAHGADAVRYRHAQRKHALDFRNETLRPFRQPGAVKPASIETATYRALAGAPPDTDAVQEPRGEVPQAPPPETDVVVVYEHDHVTDPEPARYSPASDAMRYSFDAVRRNRLPRAIAGVAIVISSPRELRQSTSNSSPARMTKVSPSSLSAKILPL